MNFNCWFDSENYVYVIFFNGKRHYRKSKEAALELINETLQTITINTLYAN